MDIQSTVRQYLRLKDEITLLNNRTDQLKEELLNAVDQVEVDDRGHKKLTVDDEFKGEVLITKQRKVSKILDMDIAETILTAKGIKDQCIKMVPILDESSIMRSFQEGLLTEEDIDTMFPSKVTWALVMTKS